MNDNHTELIPSSDALITDFFTRRCKTSKSLSLTQKLDRAILALIAAVAFTVGSPLCTMIAGSEPVETTAQVAAPVAPLRPTPEPGIKSPVRKYFSAVARISP